MSRVLELDAGGLGLEVLGAADLAAVGWTAELFDMFWALNGATCSPRLASARRAPVTTSDLPASEEVPANRMPLIRARPFDMPRVSAG